jgi:hypothetical protein
MTISRSRRVLGTLVGAGAVLMVAQPALAATWYSSSSPLKVTESGSTQGAAYGDFYNSNGTYAKSASTRKDYKKGGDGIYVDTKWYFLETSCDSLNHCSSEYVGYGHNETGRTTSGKWVDETEQKGLRAGASAARGGMHVCEDQSFSGDPCSATVIKTFTY